MELKHVIHCKRKVKVWKVYFCGGEWEMSSNTLGPACNELPN